MVEHPSAQRPGIARARKRPDPDKGTVLRLLFGTLALVAGCEGVEKRRAQAAQKQAQDRAEDELAEAEELARLRSKLPAALSVDFKKVAA